LTFTVLYFIVTYTTGMPKLKKMLVLPSAKWTTCVFLSTLKNSQTSHMPFWCWAGSSTMTQGFTWVLAGTNCGVSNRTWKDQGTDTQFPQQVVQLAAQTHHHYNYKWQHIGSLFYLTTISCWFLLAHLSY